MSMEGQLARVCSEQERQAAQRVTCSPETDPATMRVRRPETGGKRTLDERETHPGADRPQAARSGCPARRRGPDPRGRQAVGHQRGNLPPLEEPVRWDEGRRDEAA